jgi:hypothetical protein
VTDEGLEPLSPYDAEGMATLAGVLEKHAQSLGATSDQVTGSAGSMTFDGPAGSRVKEELGSSSSALTAAAQQLHAAAGQLAAGAQAVVDQNAAIQRHNDAVREANARKHLTVIGPRRTGRAARGC